MTDLQSLLERVKAASGPDQSLDADICDALDVAPSIGGPVNPRTGPVKSYPLITRSIDSALALVERCLPGWQCSAIRVPPDPCEGHVWERGQVGSFQGKAPTLALAVVIALLSAPIHLQQGEAQ